MIPTSWPLTVPSRLASAPRVIWLRTQVLPTVCPPKRVEEPAVRGLGKGNGGGGGDGGGGEVLGGGDGDRAGVDGESVAAAFAVEGAGGDVGIIDGSGEADGGSVEGDGVGVGGAEDA